MYPFAKSGTVLPGGLKLPGGFTLPGKPTPPRQQETALSPAEKQMREDEDRFNKTVFGETAGPKDWAINPDAHLTAVVAHKGRVVKSFGYMSLNETNVPEVLQALKKAIKK